MTNGAVAGAAGMLARRAADVLSKLAARVFAKRKLLGGLDRHIIHFAPGRKRLLAIFLIALFVTALCYSLLLQLAYSGIADAVSRADAVETTLRTIPNYPIGPKGVTDDRRLAGKSLGTAGAYEVLRAWGVFGKNVQIGQLLQEGGDKMKEEKVILKTLIQCTNKAGNNPTTVLLIRCAFTEFGGNDQTGQDKNCFWPDVDRALAGYPLSGETLSENTATRLVDKQPAGGECPTSADGWNTLRFAYEWFGEARDDAGILRDMLLATNTLPYPPTELEVANSGGGTLPSWWHFSGLKLRFLEEAISRLESEDDVKSARSWLVLWRGPEQFFLIFTGLALLLLLGDRVLQRKRVKREAERVLVNMHRALDKVLKEPDAEARSVAAKRLANRLENRKGDGITSEFVAYPKGRKDLGVRLDSVVLYMAEKAVRRIVIEPREPELFRQTCDGINAEVERSSWVLRYASRALPAIGFIGTVRGIMLALPAAQSLFGATGPAQIAALNNVIEPLGLAFATTLIALVAGLITGLVGDWEVAQEQVLLSRIEESLIDRIDPAEE